MILLTEIPSISVNMSVEKNLGGRPSKFTPELQEKIIYAISKRVPYILAAQANGISERTLYSWLEQGERDQDNATDSDFARFLQALKETEMQKIVEHSDIIASKPERWQADAWLLERRWYKYYGSNAAINELNERLARLENEGKIPTSKSE